MKLFKNSYPIRVQTDFIVGIIIVFIVMLVFIAMHTEHQQKEPPVVVIDTAAFVHAMDSIARNVGYDEMQEAVNYNDSGYPTRTIQIINSKATHKWEFFHSDTTKGSPEKFSISWDSVSTKNLTVTKHQAYIQFYAINSRLVLGPR